MSDLTAPSASPPARPVTDEQWAEFLRDGLWRTARRAQIEAEGGAPGPMIALYVSQEVAHAISGHTDPESGVDCPRCIFAIGDRPAEPDARGAHE